MGRILNYSSWALSSTYYGIGDIKKAGLAVVHSSPVTANLAPMVARVLFRTPYVTMIMDLWPDSVFQSGFLTSGPVHRIASAILGTFAKWSYRLASHITVLSPSMKQVLVDRGVPAEKISLLYNWVDESLFASPAEPDPTLRASLGLTGDDFVGVNMPSKIPSLLAGGHPVLVVAEGDPADVVTAADAGLAASPNDPAAVATALRQAKSAGADMLREMGHRGRELYEREMSSAIGGARLTEILRTAKRKGRT